jgi:gamma-glutamyl-gamma-aminobutyrate hydrolase PuuD
METKLYVVGGDINYANWIPNIKIVHSVEDCDVIMFTGGEDVNPKVYGHKVNGRTFYNEQRDRVEILEFFKAQELGKKCIGICRGFN